MFSDSDMFSEESIRITVWLLSALFQCMDAADEAFRIVPLSLQGQQRSLTASGLANYLSE